MQWLTIGLLAILAPLAAWAEEGAVTPSVGAGEGLDTNLYGTSTNLAGHPDVAGVSSWFTTLCAKISIDGLKATRTGNRGFLKTVALDFAADATLYDAAAREDNLRNTVALAVGGAEGPWSLSLDNTLLYVDGSKEDVFYATYNNLGYAPTRERRNQVQERNASSFRYDSPHWFARIADSATYYNLLIDEHDPIGAYKGYANWVNRDDVNAGADFGFKAAPDFAFVAGWRVGSQTQARLDYSPVDNDNTYNRILLGFEGRPSKRLRVAFTAGPDFRRYGDGANSGIAGDRHTWFYTQSRLTATLSPRDTLAAANKVWHFVSSAGTSSIQEATTTISLTHVFTRSFSASLAGTVLGHRYDFPAVRNDWTRAYALNLTYALTRGLSLRADYTDTSGQTHLSPLVSPGQNFSDNLVSLSLKARF